MANEEAGSRVWVPDELFSWRSARLAEVSDMELQESTFTGSEKAGV